MQIFMQVGISIVATPNTIPLLCNNNADLSLWHIH